jgi:6-phosphogluconolactonase (cycloisomerase 2 family)
LGVALAALATSVLIIGGVAFAGIGAPALEHVAGAKDEVGGVTALDEPYDVSLSGDHRFVYATSQSEDALTVLRRKKPSQKLVHVQTYQDGVDGVINLESPQSVEISPDNRYAYVTASSTNSLHMLEHNDETGIVYADGIKINGLGGVHGMVSPAGIAVSPNSEFVYVSGVESNSIAVFHRQVNGKHPFVQASKGAPGLEEPWDLTVSPDGDNLYVAAESPGAVVAYSRNKVTGKLTHIQSLRDGIGVTNFLSNASGIAVAPNGRNVYVAAADDDAVPVFNRNLKTGRLSLEQVVRDDVAGVDGLAGAYDVTVTPDGKSAYVAGYEESEVAAFTRKPKTGRLVYQGSHRDGDLGDVGGVWRITSDDDAVYAAAYADDAITAFRRFFD